MTIRNFLVDPFWKQDPREPTTIFHELNMNYFPHVFYRR